MTIVLHGPPRTKKNSPQLIGGRIPRMLPSAAFREWNRLVQPQLAIARAGARGLPFREPVAVKALFFRDRRVGDLCNFMQALGDALEEGGILLDDKIICSWDGTRLLLDRANPRVIVTLEPMDDVS